MEHRVTAGEPWRHGRRPVPSHVHTQARPAAARLGTGGQGVPTVRNDARARRRRVRHLRRRGHRQLPYRVSAPVVRMTFTGRLNSATRDRSPQAVDSPPAPSVLRRRRGRDRSRAGGAVGRRGRRERDVRARRRHVPFVALRTDTDPAVFLSVVVALLATELRRDDGHRLVPMVGLSLVAVHPYGHYGIPWLPEEVLPRRRTAFSGPSPGCSSRGCGRRTCSSGWYRTASRAPLPAPSGSANAESLVGTLPHGRGARQQSNVPKPCADINQGYSSSGRDAGDSGAVRRRGRRPGGRGARPRGPRVRRPDGRPRSGRARARWVGPTASSPSTTCRTGTAWSSSRACAGGRPASRSSSSPGRGARRSRARPSAPARPTTSRRTPTSRSCAWRTASSVDDRGRRRARTRRAAARPARTAGLRDRRRRRHRGVQRPRGRVDRPRPRGGHRRTPL